MHYQRRFMGALAPKCSAQVGSSGP